MMANTDKTGVDTGLGGGGKYTSIYHSFIRIGNSFFLFIF